MEASSGPSKAPVRSYRSVCPPLPLNPTRPPQCRATSPEIPPHPAHNPPRVAAEMLLEPHRYCDSRRNGAVRLILLPKSPDMTRAGPTCKQGSFDIQRTQILRAAISTCHHSSYQIIYPRHREKIQPRQEVQPGQQARVPRWRNRMRKQQERAQPRWGRYRLRPGSTPRPPDKTREQEGRIQPRRARRQLRKRQTTPTTAPKMTSQPVQPRRNKMHGLRAKMQPQRVSPRARQ